ncbi:hypothetical protein [Rhodococcus sp. NBC_00297]|uniref:hypothetical protein n=1 Tax=Rhodococcus sp. NBC_00297 TaxID=2976005 RepID=UPI002E2CBFF3|nr:hypothetical protein [Rhodococcus sp. NBC_00297]
MCTPALIQATAVTRKRYGHVLAILTALALSMTGCTTHDLAETSPAQTQQDRTAITETMRKYFDAYNTGDVAELNKNSCVAAQRTDATHPRSQRSCTTSASPPSPAMRHPYP